jgi:threonine synthase
MARKQRKTLIAAPAMTTSTPTPSRTLIVTGELEVLYATGGTAVTVTVTDEELLADQRAVARLKGSLICPEGAACVAAVRQPDRESRT